MSVPPYACAFAVSVASSIISDRYKVRGFVTMFAALCLTIGYAIFLGMFFHLPPRETQFYSIVNHRLDKKTYTIWRSLLPN